MAFRRSYELLSALVLALVLSSTALASSLELRFPVNAIPDGALTLADFAQFRHDLYSGANPFYGVGGAVRDTNRLGESEKHTTVGTDRDLPKGSTSCVAFDWRWDTAFKPIGWVLVAQLQMSSSPIWAMSVDKQARWFLKVRNGSDNGINYTLAPIAFGHWTYFVVCTYLADKPAGYVRMWWAVDQWPDVTQTPRVNRTGIQTWQGITGKNTIGIYAQHFAGSSKSYVGLFAHWARAATPARAIALAN